MAECNPWSRLVLSEHSCLTNLRAWILKHVRNTKGLNTHIHAPPPLRIHHSGSKASPPKSFNRWVCILPLHFNCFIVYFTQITPVFFLDFSLSCLSGSTSENTISRTRCNSNSSQTPSPKMHNSPSFTFGCPPPRAHVQHNSSTHAGGRGSNKTLGPVRGKFIPQPPACAFGWNFLPA